MLLVLLACASPAVVVDGCVDNPGACDTGEGDAGVCRSEVPR